MDVSGFVIASEEKCRRYLLSVLTSARMSAHHRPIYVWRDSLEHFGVVATFHVLEECVDFFAGRVGG